ncbi:MAG: AAA family ATPase [Deltaproteobacteria bacterium]|nr:AAA family ATPase [Deltaproteobacteria bacterium]
MSLVYISSTGYHAGQTLITWTIAERLRAKGLNPGFFKPFCADPVLINGIRTDPDAFLFREILNIREPLEKICPFTDPESIAGNQNQILDIIKKSAGHLLSGRDLLLIMGSKDIFFDGDLYSIPDVSVISELNADVILVHRCRKISTTLYSILSVHSLINKKIKGIIINRVPPDRVEEVERLIIPALNEKGIYNISFIPEDPKLSSRRLEEICAILDGKVIFGEDFLNNPVERMSVGTTNLSGDLLLFKRVYNKIILLGPSNDFGIAGIILTGGKEPGRQILEAVKKSNIPLISIKENSLEALERLENTTPSLSPADRIKAVHCAGIMDRNGSLNKLIDSII